MRYIGKPEADGDITGVTAGTNLSGGGTSGNVTINLDGVLPVANGGTGLTGISTLLNSNTTKSDVDLGNVENKSSATIRGEIVSGDIPNNAADTSGNAATATKLAATKTIAGVAFDGSANIALNNNAITNGAGYTTNTGTISSIRLATDDSNVTAVSSGSVSWVLAGGTGIDTSQAQGGTFTVAVDASEVDHDSLLNFVAAEHYRWDTDISGTATINAANIPTLNQNTTGNAATADALTSGNKTIAGNITSETSSVPLLALKRTSTGSDGDGVGTIRFTGKDDADNVEVYAAITAEIVDASDGAEEGQLNLMVASHDGEDQAGLVIKSGDAEDEVDVTIGNGATSLTTVAGTLTMGSTATLDNSGNLLNNAATATALATARNINGVSFDGTGDITTNHYDYLHLNCQMSAASTNMYTGYGGHYNFNIGITPYTDGGGVVNKNTTKWSDYQAISAAVIDTVYYNFTSTGGSGANWVFELWEIVPGSGGNNNVTNLLKQYSITGNSDNDFIHTATDTTGYNLAAGAGLLAAIRKTSSAWSGNIFGEITIKFKY